MLVWGGSFWDCLHAENLAKIQSLCKKIKQFYKLEKVSFHKKWHETSHRCRKIDDFGENFITRESICGHFLSGELAWGPCKRSISSKNCGSVCLGKNKKIGCVLKARLGLGNCTFEVILRKCEDKNDAD